MRIIKQSKFVEAIGLLFVLGSAVWTIFVYDKSVDVVNALKANADTFAARATMHGLAASDAHALDARKDLATAFDKFVAQNATIGSKFNLHQLNMVRFGLASAGSLIIIIAKMMEAITADRAKIKQDRERLLSSQRLHGPSHSYIALLRIDNDRNYCVSFPDFPGWVMVGHDLSAAREQAEQLLVAHLKTNKLPTPSSLQSIVASTGASGGIVIKVSAECAYQAKTD